MNILYLCGSYGLKLDRMLGPKFHIYNILNGLQKAGHNPYFLAIQETTELPEFVPFNPIILQHKYLRGFVHKIVPYTGIVDSLRIFITIVRLHRKVHLDIIHERYTGLSWGGILASKFIHIPLIVQMVGPGIEEKEIQRTFIKGSKKFLLLIHQKLMMKSQRGLVLVSSKIADFIKIKRGWKIPSWYVLPDGADNNFFYDQQKTEELKNKYKLIGYKTIIYSGSLYRWYGILRVFKAFKIVTTQIPDAKLIIIGNGDAISEISDYIRQNNIQDRVLIIPAIPHSEMNNYLQIADIALAHYTKEHTYTGNTAKISEYMAAGKVVVTTPNMDEILTDGLTGFISPSFSIEDYAQTIIKALKNKKRNTIGKNARNLILKKYTWNQYIEKLLRIYKKALNQTK